ncbi:MAG TPA: AAA family ATPase [Catalimonadaceae bacterium]|jgi:AAA15 family ATPase/GTPase|nr:AAA family ATPase [Catalimonadaceae bacterium]
MIKRIQIENFKSFGKVDLEPHSKVNLLIGPNSSGKSNFLEAVSFFYELHNEEKIKDGFIKFREKVNKRQTKGFRESLVLTIDGPWVVEPNQPISYRHKLETLSIQIENFLGDFALGFSDDKSIVAKFDSTGGISFKGSTLNSEYLEGYSSYCHFIRPELKAMRNSMKPERFSNFSMDLSNLVRFINHIRDNDEDRWNSYCKTFFRITNEFQKVTKRDKGSEYELQFHTENDLRFGPNEVSDGIILFAGLLAILHQPNPPKVILLEEPENGIHPRRLSEIISLIWKLAEEKEVQFFITTHSPIILDQFSEYPECVWVFDKKEGITEIQNVEKIIESKHAFAKANGLPELDYTAELSENWLWGLLDGVPPVTQI